MPESDGSKPGSKADPKVSPKVASPPAAGQPDQKATGRVVHDDRGNAVWDWIVETGRIFIGNTSRLLQKLDAPELKIEDTQPELRLESERDPGGGYDPYGRSAGGGKSGTRSASPTTGGGGTKPSQGGGYDPYSREVPRKPGRKP